MSALQSPRPTPARATLGTAATAHDALDRVERTVQALLDLEHAAHDAESLAAVLSTVLADFLHAVAGAERAGVPSTRLHALIAPARALVARAPFFRRCQQWPRNYPGDFETVVRMCEPDNACTPGTLAHALEAWALASPIVAQHRHKVAHQGALIADVLRRVPGARVLVVACGPGLDVAAALRAHAAQAAQAAHADDPRAPRPRIVLNDADPDALAHARARLATRRADRVAELVEVEGNVLRRIAALERLGPFDLVLAGGLFDYLSDRVADTLVRHALSRLLAPGGRFFFTNIATVEPFRGCLEYLVSWPLIARDEDAVRGLVARATASHGPATRVLLERDATGLTVMAEVQPLPADDPPRR